MQDPNERRVIQEEVVQTPYGSDARVVEQRTRVDPTPAERQLGSLYRAKQVVWFIVGAICVLIGLRFVLLLLGANVDTGFGSLILAITSHSCCHFCRCLASKPRGSSSPI